MTRATVRRVVLECLSGQLCLAPGVDRLLDDGDSLDTLGMGPAGLPGVLLEVEDCLGVSVRPSALGGLRTVGQLVGLAVAGQLES